MKIAILLPTRGLIFAETILTLFREFKEVDHEFIIVSGLPIPDSHNTAVQKGLETDCDWFLFIEEDMVIPEGGLEEMVRNTEEAGVVIMDYPLEGTPTSIVMRGGEFLWGPLGCTLIARRVFEELPQPWFRTDKSLVITDLKNYTFVEKDIPNKYGGHDVLFYQELKKRNVPIRIVPNMKAKHLRLKSWERKTMNDGAHEIYALGDN